jgi:hypothetical protein
MRDNVQSEGPEDYFRKSIPIPFLDYTINEMKTRFTDLHASNFGNIVITEGTN